MTDHVASFLESNGTNTLEHYGVKGMKWGVRKRDYVKKGAAQNKSTPQQKKPEQKPVGGSSAPKVGVAVQPKTKPVMNPRKLTDAELTSALRRLQMEKQYSELAHPNITAGKTLVKGILVDSGKAVGKAYVSHYLGKQVAKAVKVDLNIQPEKKND